MRINKKVQYGLMIALYVTRYGRASGEEIAHDLSLSYTFVSQVAADLRRRGVIKSVRGPGGGYEIKGDPSVLDVFVATTDYGLLGEGEIIALSQGAKEQRSLLYLITNLNSAMNVVMHRKIRNLVGELNAIDAVNPNRVVQAAISDKVN